MNFLKKNNDAKKNVTCCRKAMDDIVLSHFPKEQTMPISFPYLKKLQLLFTHLQFVCIFINFGIMMIWILNCFCNLEKLMRLVSNQFK
jgi:hypothetical protein